MSRCVSRITNVNGRRKPDVRCDYRSRIDSHRDPSRRHCQLFALGSLAQLAVPTLHEDLVFDRPDRSISAYSNSPHCRMPSPCWAMLDISSLAGHGDRIDEIDFSQSRLLNRYFVLGELLVGSELLQKFYLPKSVRRFSGSTPRSSGGLQTLYKSFQLPRVNQFWLSFCPHSCRLHEGW